MSPDFFWRSEYINFLWVCSFGDFLDLDVHYCLCPIYCKLHFTVYIFCSIQRTHSIHIVYTVHTQRINSIHSVYTIHWVTSCPPAAVATSFLLLLLSLSSSPLLPELDFQPSGSHRLDIALIWPIKQNLILGFPQYLLFIIPPYLISIIPV